MSLSTATVSQRHTWADVSTVLDTLENIAHCALAHTLSANHHAVGTYLTYYSTKLCVVTFLVPCVFGLCHVSYALMGSFVCLVSAREAKLLRA